MPGRIKVTGRRHKFGAIATTVDGHHFPSKAEAARYGELKLLEKAGKITNLELQPKFPLIAGGKIIGFYVADFRYRDFDLRRYVTEDVKGIETPLFKWKRAHFEAQHGELTVVKMGRGKRRR